MNYNLNVGLEAQSIIIVNYNDTAKNLKSGLLEVLSTPSVIALMEASAVDAVQPYLPEGFSTVGTMVNIQHIAATPIDMTVTSYAELIEIDDRKLTFRIQAHNERELVSEGYHERFIIENEKFIKKTYNK